MRLIAFALAACIGTTGVANSQAPNEISEKIRAGLEALVASDDFSIEELLANTQNSNFMPATGLALKNHMDGMKVNGLPIDVANYFAGDYGYLVTDRLTGAPIDMFDAGVDIAVDDDQSILILGYEPPANSEISLVTGAEAASARQQLFQEYVDRAQDSRTTRTIDDVALGAQTATMTWAARLCPGFVYPAEVTLFLDAGFNFVVVNSNTGTQITINMNDACNGYFQLIDVELQKRGIIID